MNIPTNLMYYVTRMRFLLNNVPMDKRGIEWAHSLCTCSRFIHINVWTFCAPHRIVREELIPLLTKSAEEIRVLQVNLGEEKLDKYAQNIKTRIKNINNYLEGKRSAFVPDDKISEWEAATA